MEQKNTNYYSNTFSIFELTKMKTLKRPAVYLFLVIILLVASCGGEGICTDDLVTRVSAGFYVRDPISERDTTLNFLTFYGALRPDSLIYDSALNISGIKFPLSNDGEGITSFVFNLDSVEDGIHIQHTTRIELVSYECGFTTMHEISGVSFETNIIDTITIQNPSVTLFSEEHLKIYIKPAVVADSAR